MTMMRGNNRVRELVGTYFENHLTPYIDTLRAQNSDLDENYLPYPSQYLSSDPFDTDQHKFPVIGTYFTNADNFSQMELRFDGSSDYKVTYSATIFVTVRTPLLGYDASGNKTWAKPTRASAIKARDDMVAAMRACILASPSLGTVDMDYGLYVDYDSMREAYPEPMELTKQAGIWVCSGLINIDIQAIEKLENPIVGTVDEFNLDVEKIPYDGYWEYDDPSLSHD